MATFTAACYDDKGVVTMSETAKVQLIADKNAATATVATQASTIDELETINIQLEADLKNAEADNDKMPLWAIAIIVVLGAVLVLVIVTLAVVVSR